MDIHIDQLKILIFQFYVGPGAPTTLNPALPPYRGYANVKNKLLNK